MLLIVAILSDSCLLSSHRLHRERHTNLSDLVHRATHAPCYWSEVLTQSVCVSGNIQLYGSCDLHGPISMPNRFSMVTNCLHCVWRCSTRTLFMQRIALYADRRLSLWPLSTWPLLCREKTIWWTSSLWMTRILSLDLVWLRIDLKIDFKDATIMYNVHVLH